MIHQKCKVNFIVSLNSVTTSALVNCEQPALSLTERISKMYENSFFLRWLSHWEKNYRESNNILIFFIRSITDSISDRFGGLFKQTEAAQAIVLLRKIDSSFSTDKFLREARDFIIPEVLESFLTGEMIKLKEWTSEATFNMLKANFDAMCSAGCTLEGTLFDLRNLELVALKVLENDKPVIVLSFQTQQIMVVKDLKTGLVVEGDEERLERFGYVWALTKEPTSASLASNTNGWKILELSIRQI